MAGPSVSKRLPMPVFLTDGTGIYDISVTRSSVGMTGVTSNTTSSTVASAVGPKTFWAEVVGTGAVTATVAFYGARTSSAANGVLLATITLSGTTQAQDAAGASFAPYPYYYIVTTGVTGTGATVQAEIFV